MIIYRNKPERARAIQSIAIGSLKGLTDTTTATAAIGHKDGSIDVINPNIGTLKWRINAHESTTRKYSSTNEADSASIEGLHVCFSGPAAAAASPVIISCTAGGSARLHAAPSSSSPEDDPMSTKARVLVSFKVPATVCCSVLDEPTGFLAVGSQGAELRVFDLALPDQPAVFNAKGSKPNRVGLVDKPWNSAVAFFPGSQGKKIWTGTGYHKLRLYDSTASKRPQTEVDFGQARITALAPEADGQRVWVANATGSVEVFDVRAGRFSGAIKGIAGSVRDLALYPSIESSSSRSTSGEHKRNVCIASVGLDRFLRVHSCASRNSLGKEYLKTQLTAVAWCPTDMSMAAVTKAAAEKKDEKEDDLVLVEEEEEDEELDEDVDRIEKKRASGRGGREASAAVKRKKA
jgi:ribosome biogenesis protein NSA1